VKAEWLDIRCSVVTWSYGLDCSDIMLGTRVTTVGSRLVKVEELEVLVEVLVYQRHYNSK